ncbi:tetratricopeptide repeat protein [Algoriphagus sp. D3-2-R+10]|uniref:tetratricopeptide repeat-containing sensor histidine kinase n=1 Tax=Algoriphagus aurantiacus TaxID=3103948 RepID=UPI002B37DD1F|nr:tetratricopeptide repeat protein [Algoriphagus sp. D3-2-R+10]MEB2773853.1 tetratricopeptide repeat protein [Algoriphagus sp. D3-2-R+10]
MNIFKHILFLPLFSFTLSNGSLAQTTRADSLLNAITQLNDDSVKVSHYVDLGLEYLGSDTKSAIYYFDEAILLGNKINFKNGLAKAYNAKGRAYAQQGNFQESILKFQEALKFFREINDKTGVANILSNLGSIYYMLGNNTKALELHFESLNISEELNNKLRIGTSLNNIGTVYQNNRSTTNEALSFFKKSLEVFQGIEEEQGMATASMNIGEVYFIESKYDSAIYFHQMALELCDGTIDATFPLTQLGEINAELGNFQKANSFHRRALEISERLDAKFELTQSLIGLAKTQRKQMEFESAINTLERAKLLAIDIDAKNELVDVYLNLAEIQALVGDYKAAYENEINTKSVKEEIAKSSTEQMIQQLQFEFELNKKEAEIELLQKDTELKNAAVFNQRIIIFTSLGGLLMFVIISISLYRNNLSKQKANRLLRVQKEEIRVQRENVESAYDQLKSTQAQLIQSEKMASLGELTAGIAHEIKNPLNFVNNFSDVCTELIDEMKVELAGGNQTVAIEIADDIKRNLQKINQHGKRADSIVQGMLEHSRTSIGEKVETDINGLAVEYLRLSYLGLKSKDSSINVDLLMDLDPNLLKINVVPQKIVRVLLNLFNNAFYAVIEKAKIASSEYKPQISISTKKTKNGIQLSVKDNGNGIPVSIKEKIFQPFFTTKPTGQGTGLGLSLSYDIVKGHGGEIKVESREGEGTEFILLLPV